MTLCSKNVNGLCQNKATEILCTRTLWGEWEKYPRCADHAAAAGEAVLKRMSPSVVTIIERLAPSPDREG